MDSINFQKNIRPCNNVLAFARNGPQVIRICGQIYHNIYALHPNKNEARKCGQLYVLDNEKATAQRKNQKSNSDIKAELLSELNSLLRNVNPYAKVYKMMYEVDTRLLTLAQLYFDDEHMRRFTSTVPARGARAPNRAISNSCL